MKELTFRGNVFQGSKIIKTDDSIIIKDENNKELKRLHPLSGDLSEYQLREGGSIIQFDEDDFDEKNNTSDVQYDLMFYKLLKENTALKEQVTSLETTNSELQTNYNDLLARVSALEGGN